jgi:serine/threonine protein kinase
MPEPANARVNHEHDYPMVGETIGLWRLVRGLGRGGMGEVYEGEYDYHHLLSLRYGLEQRELIRMELEALPRAEQARLVSKVMGTPLPADAHFAIKICNARSGTPGYRRFLQEAELAQRLGDHPYIVTVHQVSGPLDAISEMAKKFALDQGKYRDLAYMVMDLATSVIDPTRLTIGEAVHVVRCIATALDHAHSQGVVHRDLKPENILATIEHPLLTDFGIAKEIDQSEGLTRTGQIIGTLDYMSPEQATDAKRVDHRSDIYSLGVVLYEFATQGHLPYSDKLDRDSCLAAIRNDRFEPRWPREHMPRFPVRLERIILKAMAHRQEERYQAMSDFITDLDRFTRGEPVHWWGRVNPRSLARFHLRRHPRLVWGSVAGVVLVLAILASLWIPQALDATRRDIVNKLEGIDRQIGQIESRKRMQLDHQAETDRHELDSALSNDKYPELKERLVDLEERLLAAKRLELYFDPALQPVHGTDTVLAPPEALEQLKLATGVDTLTANCTANGLCITEDTQLKLRNFGHGVVFWYAVLQLPPLASYDAFSVVVQEEDPENGSKHQLSWLIKDGWVTLESVEDEVKQVTVLRREPLPQNLHLSLALEVGPDHIRSWTTGGKMERYAIRGLRDNSPASITMALPKDTYVGKLIVNPRAPK